MAYVDNSQALGVKLDNVGEYLTVCSGDPIIHKEFNCPDCERKDTCEGCPRTLTNNKQLHINTDFPDSIIWRSYDNQFIPDCCKNCSNHPSNNPYASGVCNCSLPSLTQITY